MKKVISILLVLCVAVTLFAAGSVKVGGAFNFVTGGTRDFERTVYNDAGTKIDGPTDTKSNATYKMHGFGFDLAGDFDVAQNLAVWADFNMVFCADAKVTPKDSTEISFEDDYYKGYVEDNKDKAYKKINIISFSAGAAYKLSLNPVDVKLGGGLFIDRGFAKTGTNDANKKDIYTEFKSVNFGLALLADCNYKFNKNFGVGLTVMPHIGLYNSTTFEGFDEYSPDVYYKSVLKAKGFKLSFAMPVVLGVSYSF